MTSVKSFSRKVSPAQGPPSCLTGSFATHCSSHSPLSNFFLFCCLCILYKGFFFLLLHPQPLLSKCSLVYSPKLPPNFTWFFLKKSFLKNPLIPLSASHICPGIELPTGAWVASPELHPWRKMTYPLPDAINCRWSPARGGFCEFHPHLCCSVDWLDLARILCVLSQSLRVHSPVVSGNTV